MVILTGFIQIVLMKRACGNEEYVLIHDFNQGEKMRILKRGTMIWFPDGTKAFIGWVFDHQGQDIDLDEIAVLLEE